MYCGTLTTVGLFGSRSSSLLGPALQRLLVGWVTSWGIWLLNPGGFGSVQFNSVQLLSHVWLFVIPWTTELQASLPITNSRSPPKPIYIVSVMPSNHLILCRSLLLLPSIFPRIRVFSNDSALCIRWQGNGVSASTSVLPVNTKDFSNITVQKHQFFCTQLSLLSNSHIHTRKTIALTRWTFVGKVMSLLFNM